jgi:DNA-binding MarR family transcriptional regulator
MRPMSEAAAAEAVQHDHLFRLLEQAGRRFRAEFGAVLAERRLDLPLSGSRARVLQHVPATGVRPTELAAALHMTKQSLGELLADLEASGLVERRPDPTDGRAWQVRTTRRGRRMSALVDGIAREAEERLAASFDADDFAAFRRVVTALASEAVR